MTAEEIANQMLLMVDPDDETREPGETRHQWGVTFTLAHPTIPGEPPVLESFSFPARLLGTLRETVQSWIEMEHDRRAFDGPECPSPEFMTR